MDIADTSADRLVIDEAEPMEESGVDDSAVIASSSSLATEPPVDTAATVVNHEMTPRVKVEPPSGEDAVDSPVANHQHKSNHADSKCSSKSKRKKSKSSSSSSHDSGGSEPASVKSEPPCTFAASASVVFDTNGTSTPPPPSTAAIAQQASQQPSKTKKKKLSVSTDDSATPPPPKKPKTAAPIAQEKLERRDASTWVRTVASSTDPEALGPCEPGSHVALEGVVWNETPTGILVVNVTWRGKSYVGTLLDCTRHDWAPPRICESPLLDLERTPAKGRNGKRNRSSICHSASTSDLPTTSSQKNNHKKKTSKAGQLTIAIPSSQSTTAGNSDEDSLSSLPPKPTSAAEHVLEPLSPVLRPCPCVSCDKRFAEPVAMKFHQTAAHPKPPSPVPAEPDPPSHASTSNGDTNCNKVLTNEEIENESLAALFNVVVDKSSALTSRASGSDDLPKLEPPAQPEVDRSARTPGAYSDISDDGAPFLEKETAGADKNGLSPKKGDKIRSSTPVASASAENGVAGGTPKVAPSNSHSKRPPSNKEAPDSPVGANVPVASASTTTESPSSRPSSKPITTVATSSPTASYIPAVGPAVPGPMLPGGLVMPFGPPTTSFGGPHTSPFLRPPPISVLPPFSHGLFVPQMPPPPSPNLSSNKQQHVQHKIHELKSAASPPTSGKGSVATTTSMSSSKGGDVVMTTSVIPPVQRHLHMHQHTHSFPLYPPPLDFSSNPYAATAAMFAHSGTPINLAYPPK